MPLGRGGHVGWAWYDRHFDRFILIEGGNLSPIIRVPPQAYPVSLPVTQGRLGYLDIDVFNAAIEDESLAYDLRWYETTGMVWS